MRILNLVLPCGAMLATLALMLVSAAATASHSPTLELVWIEQDGAELARRELLVSGVEAIEEVEIETSTPWTQSVHRFSGPRLATLAALEEGSVVKAKLVALNDYSIEIPADDWEKYDIVLAPRADGERMRVRDRGPFWLIYPLDAHTELQSQRYHARMVWQVTRIVFVVNSR